MDTHNYYGQQDTDYHIVPITLGPHEGCTLPSIATKCSKRPQTSQG